MRLCSLPLSISLLSIIYVIMALSELEERFQETRMYGLDKRTSLVLPVDNPLDTGRKCPVLVDCPPESSGKSTGHAA